MLAPLTLLSKWQSAGSRVPGPCIRMSSTLILSVRILSHAHANVTSVTARNPTPPSANVSHAKTRPTGQRQALLEGKIGVHMASIMTRFCTYLHVRFSQGSQ